MFGENKNLVAMPTSRLKMHRPSASPPFAAREVMRPIVAVARCRKGVVALEFVLVAPVLLLLLFALFYLGIALNNYIVLTAAAEQGAQTLSLGRGTTTPYSTATTAIDSAAQGILKTSQITQTVKIGGSSCSGDATCGALLTSGAVALVALTYPCDLTFMGLSFGGSPCTLSAQTAAIVQ
jgi:Flp pilus assembly protein TadG